MPRRGRGRAMLKTATLVVVLATALVGRGAGSRARAEGSGPLIARLGAEKLEAVLGEDERVDLVLDFEGPGAEQAVLGRIAVSVGQVVDVQRIGPATYIATYRPPPAAFPQVALAIFEWQPPQGPRRHLLWRCPLRALTAFPFRTSSRATVTVTIGDETFGPIRAEADGRVTLPLEVPPGHPSGTARAVDRYGNATETTVALSPPPFARSVMLAPESLQAGGEGEIVAAAVDAAGELVAPKDLVVLARGAKLTPNLPPASLAGPSAPTPAEGALAHFTLAAPTNVQDGPVSLKITTPDGVEEEGPATGLRAGPPASLHVVPDRARLGVGQGTSASVAVFSRDVFGNLSTLDGLTVAIDGRPFRPLVDGRVATLRIPSPPTMGPHDRVLVDAELGPLLGYAAIMLQGDRPERLAVTIERDRLSPEATQARVFVRASDRFGVPSPPRTVRIETRIKNADLGPWQSLGDSAWTTTLTAAPGRQPAAAHLLVNLAPELSAHLHLPVDPVPEKGAVAVRAGFVTNFGVLFTPSAAAEWTTTAPWLGRGWRAGVEVSHLAFRFGNGRVAPSLEEDTVADLFQVPVLGKVVRRFPMRWGLELSVGGTAGLELAVLRVTSGTPAARVTGWGLGPVAGAESELGLYAGRGQVFLGARYFLARVGRVSTGDEVKDNPLGLGLDVGYRLRW